MTIILMGYMGSGKSTVGKQLASRLSYEFVDFDAYLEAKEGMSIASIFERNGEVYFRKLESKYLKKALDIKNSIIALGGGTPCYGDNIKVISAASFSKSFYLKTSISTLVSRLFNERNKRPLIAHIKNREELQEFIGKHLFERSPFYLQAQHTITTDNQTDLEIAELIKSTLL